MITALMSYLPIPLFSSYHCLVFMVYFFQTEERVILLIRICNFQKQEIGDGVDSIRFNEILEILETDTAILKIDIEGAECKVN